MSEPKRWLDEGSPRDIEQLLRAARAEHPDQASLRRALAAVGVGLGATGVAVGANAAGAAASLGGVTKGSAAFTGGMLAKCLLLGGTVGALAVGAASVVSEAQRVAQVSAPSTPPSAGPRGRSLATGADSAPKPVVPSSILPSEKALVAPSSAPPPALVAHAPGSPPPMATPRSAVTDSALPRHEPAGNAEPAEAPGSGTPVDAETLAEEVKSIDRARAALASGRAAQALAVLDDYERRFRKRGFGPEALYLRMEANTSLGRVAEARGAAQRLLVSYPNSLHGAHARALLARLP